MTRIRYKEYPCGNHRSNHIFINDGDIGSDYYRVRIIPPKEQIYPDFRIEITNSKEQVVQGFYATSLSLAKKKAKAVLIDAGAVFFDEVRRKK